MAAIATDSGAQARILTNAIVRIAESWRPSNVKLGAILELSTATASRLRNSEALIDPASKSFDACRFLARLFRGHDALLGSDDIGRTEKSSPL